MTIATFQDAIRAAGLQPPDVIEPGKFHKFPGEGKRNSNTAAWCKLFPDSTGGIFGDYSTGCVFHGNWTPSPQQTGQSERSDAGVVFYS